MSPAVGDLVHVDAVTPDDGGPDAPAVLTVQRVTRMACGCHRLSVIRPGAAPTTWPWPMVDVTTPGCDRVWCSRPDAHVPASALRSMPVLGLPGGAR